MNVGMKWLATAVVTVSLLFSCRDAAAADTPATGGAAAADPAVWGIYSQLPGTEWSGYDGNVKWLWGPDGAIVESRTFQMKSVIRPGANRGELVSVYGGGLHTYDGRIAADGSVLWIRRGRFLKMPSRVSIVDGRFIEEMVKLDEASQVAKVNSAHPFEQTGGPRRITATAPASEERASQREVQPIVVQAMSPPVVDPVEVADNAQDQALVARPTFASFGAYAGLNGRAYVGPDGTYVLWYMSPSGTTMVSETRSADGALDNIHVIKPTTQGILLMLRSGYCPDEVCGQTGTVTDGVVTWREPKASGGRSGLMMEVRMWLEEDGNELVTQTTNPNPAGGGPPMVLAPYRLKLVDPPQRSAEIVAQSKSLVANLESRVDVDVVQSLGKQLAIRQAQDDAMEARRRSSERVQSFNRLMGGVHSAMADVDTGGYAEAQANLDATVANIQHAAAAERRAQATAQQQAPARAVDYRTEVAEQATQPQSSQSATAPVEPAAHAAPAAAKPLRFVMQISLNNQPGDKVNPSCYSNIISRPGPPGWGAPGFLPPGSAEQAREAVYSLKSAFIAQCRASGREITSDGNFNFQLNQSQGDEERLQGMRARHSEDVSVSL